MATPSVTSTKESTNYARLCRLLIDVGTQALRDTFDGVCSPGNLHSFLSSSSVQSKLKALRRKKFLNPTQWSKLFPAVPTTVTSDSFDITLLSVLLRNICGLSPPASTTSWDKLPPPADTCREADLVRIKHFRNTVYGHAEKASVDDVTFNGLWLDIKRAVVRLGGPPYAAAIAKLKGECMDPDLEDHYKEALLMWKKDEDNIKDKIEELDEKFEVFMKSSVEESGKFRDEVNKKLDFLTKRATANHQPTAGPSGTDRQQNSANPPPPNGSEGVDGNGSPSEYYVNNDNQQPDSTTRPPVQEEHRDVHTRTVDNGLPRDPSDRGEASTGNQHYENVPVSRKDTSLLNKLAVGLDRTSHRVIKDWKYLACTEEIKAPHDVWLRCGINSEKSCTRLLFSILTAEFMETTLKDMINALTSIGRNDVKRIIADCYPSDKDQEITFSDFARARSDLIFKMTSLLDQESRVASSWRNLGRCNPFKLTEERLDEIGLPQSTQVLMEYLYKRDDFSIGIFCDKVKELGREDVVKILDKFMNEREISRGTPMKAVITLVDKTMRSICVCFNKSIPGTKDWKHLAKSFDVPESIYKDCVPERPKSPTETLFEWIFAEKDPQLTVGQLCNALKSIDRNDLVKDVREYYEQQSTRQP